jgi:DNA adenine methylase
MQLRLDDQPIPKVVVNVSSVPHRSPFRYPGGKTWLVPKIREFLWSLPDRPATFVEPFAGGAIVGLTVAFESLADKVVLVELDDQVASVWKTVLSDDAGWLIDKIGTFTCTLEAVQDEMSRTPNSTKQLAFQTIVKNRTYHGGILASGSGPLKNGENGKGVSSRWYPATIQRRLSDIHRIRQRLEFIEGDGIAVIEQYSNFPDVAYFIDPPYTAAGKKAGRRLYNCFELDHDLLFKVVAGARGEFLMTYDEAEGVRHLASQNDFEVTTVPMRNTHLATMDELLIGRNLDWVKDGASVAQDPEIQLATHVRVELN